jgi:hypothetical protein
MTLQPRQRVARAWKTLAMRFAHAIVRAEFSAPPPETPTPIERTLIGGLCPWCGVEQRDEYGHESDCPVSEATTLIGGRAR